MVSAVDGASAAEEEDTLQTTAYLNLLFQNKI